MRYPAVVALLFFGFAIPACAQRAGGAHGSLGGHIGSIAPGVGSRSGGGPGAHFAGQIPQFHGTIPQFGGGLPQSHGYLPQFGGGLAAPARLPSPFGGNLRNAYPAGPSPTRPAFYSRSQAPYVSGQAGTNHYQAGHYGNREHAGYSNDPIERRRYSRFAYSNFGYPGYGFPGYFNDLGYGLSYPFWDDGFNSSLSDPFSSGQDPSGYSATSPQAEMPIPYAAPPLEYGRTAYPPQATQARSIEPSTYTQPQAKLDEEDAVTLVFKDGRPPEQIHNYAMTRSTLYVTGRHTREIPLDQLDLPATERANHEAGVTFQLP